MKFVERHPFADPDAAATERLPEVHRQRCGVNAPIMKGEPDGLTTLQ
jgi:hypothetical protein